MKVSSVEFGKKKMGFFRVGGVRQLELRGAEIDYYEPMAKATGDVSHREDPQDVSSVILTAVQSFTEREGRLAGLQVHRVMLHYHHTDGTQTDIEGNLLEIDRNDKSLRIRGNARVRHAERSLSSDEIFFRPQDKTFFTEKSYSLISTGESRRGSEIRTDLILNQLPEKTTRKVRAETDKNLNKVNGRTKYFENAREPNR